MTTVQKIAQQTRLLELASDLGNVSKVCKVISGGAEGSARLPRKGSGGHSHQQFGEIRRNFQT